MAGIILVGSRIHMAKDTVPINYITLDWSIIHRSHAEIPKSFAGKRRLTTAPLTPRFLIQPAHRSFSRRRDVVLLAHTITRSTPES